MILREVWNELADTSNLEVRNELVPNRIGYGDSMSHDVYYFAGKGGIFKVMDIDSNAQYVLRGVSNWN